MEEIEEILPDIIENNSYKYIVLDGKYISSIYIKDYPKEAGFLEIMESLPKEYICDISISIKKQNTMDILKKLSYQISYFGTEIRDINKNQIDADILEISKDDAKNLRKDIQINNEEVYQVFFYITFFHEDLNKLFNQIKLFQSKLYSKQIISNITNFRHLNSYIKTLPYLDINKNDTNYKFVTTNSIANMFPFYTKSIIDQNGIVLGNTENENKLCILDVFDDKYLNSNICIFGSSGSGKSFFAKLHILKQHLSGKRQVIFDPESEYGNLISKLEGVYITSNQKTNNFMNLLDISVNDISRFGINVLEVKINRINDFISKILNITKENEKKLIIKAIEDSYKQKNITNDVNTLYKSHTENTVYLQKEIIEKECFPTLTDVFNNIKNASIKKNFKNIILDNMKCFCNITNINEKNPVIAIDLSCYNTRTSAILMRYILENEIYKLDYEKNTNTLIYIDEVWKYIRSDLDENISDVIFSMYKTIRKKNAGIVLITQDISDLFLGENLDYAKSILNNSEFKFFFKLEYADIEVLKRINTLDEKDISKIIKLEKGSTYLIFGVNKVKIKISASEYETELIKGESV